MNVRQVRWLIAMASTAVLTWAAIRRRQALITSLPDGLQAQLQERIVLPLSDVAPEQPAESTEPTAMTRKVGANRRISVHGKLYGPFDAAIVGQQVDVVAADDRIIVRYNGDQIGDFEVEGSGEG